MSNVELSRTVSTAPPHSSSSPAVTIRRLLFQLVALTLLPITAASGWSLYTRYREMRQRVLATRVQTAELWAGSTSLYLQDVARSGVMLLLTPEETSSAEKMAEAQAFLSMYHGARGVWASWGADHAFGSGVLPGPPPWQEALRFSPGPLAAEPGPTWEWAVTDPVLDAAGDGCFWLLVRTSDSKAGGEVGRAAVVLDVQDTMVPVLARFSNRPSVNLSLVDSRGQGFFSSKEKLAAGYRDWSKEAHVQAVLTERRTVTADFISVQDTGVRKLGAGAPVDGTPWAAFVTEPFDLAMASPMRAVRLAAAGLIASLILALLLTGVADLLMGRRFQEVILAILALGQGELSYRLQVTRTDAFSDVESAFNEAAAQLAERTEENRRLLAEAAQRGAELLRTSRFLQAILESVPVGIMVLQGPDQRLAFANPAHFHFLGAQLPVTGMPPGQAETEDPALLQFLADLSEVLRTGEGRRRAGIEFQPRPGQYWEYIVSPLPDGFEGEAGVLVVYHEVTEAVEAQRLADMRLRELQAVLDFSTDPIVVYRQDGNVALANPAALRLQAEQGPADAQGVGSHQRMEDVGAPLRLEQMPFTRADGTPYQPGEGVADRALRGELVRDELQRTRGPEGDRYWLATGVPSFRPDGSVERALLFTKEVTALKQLEQAKDVFLSIASHELKTPLTAMGGYVDLVTRSLRRLEAEHPWPEDGSLQPLRSGIVKAVERLNLAHSAMRHMAGLLDDLLDVSRLQTGRLRLNRRPIEMGRLLSGLAERWQTTTDRHAILVDAPEPVWVEGDAARLEQVFSNLLSNAIKYSPDGGEIVLALRREAEQALVAVSDHGEGISPANVPRLFDLFYRVRAEQNIPGLGLGLFVSRQIVLAHGGQIDVRSRPGQGSTFLVRLPAAPSA